MTGISHQDDYRHPGILNRKDRNTDVVKQQIRIVFIFL